MSGVAGSRLYRSDFGAATHADRAAFGDRSPADEFRFSTVDSTSAALVVRHLTDGLVVRVRPDVGKEGGGCG